MTVSQLSQDLTGDWTSAAVMETDLAGCRGGLQRRDTHLTRNSRSGTGCETRPGCGRGSVMGHDHRRPGQMCTCQYLLSYLHLLLPVPTARPAEG